MSASRTPLLLPVGDKIVVKPIDLPDMIGRLHIPEQARGKSNEGTVIAVGPGRPDFNGHIIRPTIHIGERVFFGRYAGVELEVDGEKLLVLREDEILTVVK